MSIYFSKFLTLRYSFIKSGVQTNGSNAKKNKALVGYCIISKKIFSNNFLRSCRLSTIWLNKFKNWFISKQEFCDMFCRPNTMSNCAEYLIEVHGKIEI